MAAILNDDFMVCQDCLLIIGNNDDSGMSQERAAQVRAGIRQAQQSHGGHVVPGEAAQDKDFSTFACDCCADRLGGARFHCVILGA